MPVYERKWVLRRINEEVEKRNEAEKQAVNKAANSPRWFCFTKNFLAKRQFPRLS